MTAQDLLCKACNPRNPRLCLIGSHNAQEYILAAQARIGPNDDGVVCHCGHADAISQIGDVIARGIRGRIVRADVVMRCSLRSDSRSRNWP